MFPRGVSQFFSVLFFATIYLLGIDSQIGIMESLLTYIKDSLEEAGRRVNEPLVVTLTCCALFVCSLPLCTDAGKCSSSAGRGGRGAGGGLTHRPLAGAGYYWHVRPPPPPSAHALTHRTAHTTGRRCSGITAATCRCSPSAG